MIISGCTDIGCRYEENQDCYRAGKLGENLFWLLICDGMGGLALGGKASRLAASFIGERLQKELVDLADVADISAYLTELIARCNKEVRKQGMLLAEGSMGTTVVVAVVRGQDAVIAHCGDSRAYHLQKRQFRRVTRDHSVVQELLDAGRLTEEQAMHHPNKNIITSALGVDTDAKIDIDTLRLQKGDILLLCSDGLSNMVSDGEMEQLLRDTEFYSAARVLVDNAVQAGGFDNITAVLLQA